MSEELEEALRFDSLAEAEKVTGKSYKEDESVVWLGMAIGQQHRKKEAALLFLNQDTGQEGETVESFIGILQSMGFGEVLKDAIEGTKDSLYIFWKPGVLLVFTTYWEGRTINSGTAYFYFRGPRKSLDGCSNGRVSGEDEASYVWDGSRDVRKGLRCCLDKLDRTGSIISPWPQARFLWLLDYNEPKQEGYDYKAITNARIGRLPEHVQKDIAFRPTPP